MKKSMKLAAMFMVAAGAGTTMTAGTVAYWNMQDAAPGSAAQEEADAAGMVFNGAMLPPPEEEAENEEPAPPGTPRLLSLKDDGWD